MDLSAAVARRVTVLGSTGSIGISTLDVIAHARKTYGADAFPIEALTAQSNVEALVKQSRQFKPKMAVIGDPALGAKLRELLAGTGIATASGYGAVIEAAARTSDIVMVAIVGAASL